MESKWIFQIENAIKNNPNDLKTAIVDPYAVNNTYDDNLNEDHEYGIFIEENPETWEQFIRCNFGNELGDVAHDVCINGY